MALDAKNARAHYFLALAQAAQGMLEEPLKHYSIACSLQPAVDKAPELHFLLSRNLARAGRIPEALRSAQKALELAKARGDTNLVATIKARMEDYRQKAGRQDKQAHPSRSSPVPSELDRTELVEPGPVLTGSRAGPESSRAHPSGRGLT